VPTARRLSQTLGLAESLPVKIDRTADIPIRHRWADYVCCIGYFEYEEEFHLISARYADPQRTTEPTNAMNLYLRVLKEPALRASLLEALTPDKVDQITKLREEAITERGKNIGFSAGFMALCFTGLALYALTRFLAKYIGYEWAEIITYLPMFFAFLVVFPVQHLVQGWYIRRYCTQNSHRLETFKDKNGKEITWCRRCSLRFQPSKDTHASSAREA